MHDDKKGYILKGISKSYLKKRRWYDMELENYRKCTIVTAAKVQEIIDKVKAEMEAEKSKKEA